MIFLLSPAKTLKSVQNAVVKATSPTEALAGKAQSVLTELQALTPAQLKSLLKVSDAIAKLNYERYHSWANQVAVPAALAFDGPAYKGLQADDMDDASLQYLQRHLRILCGLYGILRPLDALKPYRLEMGTRLQIGNAANLYEYWRDGIAEYINAELEALPEQERFVINCASQEYFKAVDAKRLDGPVINVAFQDNSTFRVKQARGAIVRHMCLLGATHPSELKSFTGCKLKHDPAHVDVKYRRSYDQRSAVNTRSKATSNGKSPPARMAGAAGKAASASTETAKNAVRRSGIQVDDQPARKKQPAAEEMAARDQKRVKRTARR